MDEDEVPNWNRIDDNNNGLPDILAIPSPTLSIIHLGRRRVRDIVNRKSCFLRATAILDMIVGILILGWISLQLADPDKITLTLVVIILCHFLQFMMGTVIIMALRIRNDKSLVMCLRLYLMCCYIVLGTNTIVVIGAITITSMTETNDYERRQQILCSMVSIVLKFPGTILVQDLLKKHHDAVTALVALERRLRRQNFTGRLLHQRAPQIPLIFGRNDETGAAPIEIVV